MGPSSLRKIFSHWVSNFQVKKKSFQKFTLSTAACFERPELLIERPYWVVGKHFDLILRTDQYTSFEYQYHPKYSWRNSRNRQYDLAIVTTDRRVGFSRRVRPICLPKVDEQFNGKLATIIGW